MHRDADSEETPTDLMLVSRVAELEIKLAYLTNRQQIVEVLRHYTRGLNRHDIELLKSAFWPDAQVNYGNYSGLRDEWIETWQKRHSQGTASQAHHLTNESMDVAGNVAHVESYLIAFQRTKDEKMTLIRGGRYIDRIDRRNGEWRIAVREYIPHLFIEANSVFHRRFFEDLNWPKPSLGAQDGSDLSYQRPLNRRSSNR